jgi:hypothetical protein
MHAYGFWRICMHWQLTCMQLADRLIGVNWAAVVHACNTRSLALIAVPLMLVWSVASALFKA